MEPSSRPHKTLTVAEIDAMISMLEKRKKFLKDCLWAVRREEERLWKRKRYLLERPNWKQVAANGAVKP